MSHEQMMGAALLVLAGYATRYLQGVFFPPRYQPHPEHLDDLYEAHWDGLWRGHKLTETGQFHRRDLDALADEYLQTHGYVQAGQASLTATEEL